VPEESADAELGQWLAYCIDIVLTIVQNDFRRTGTHLSMSSLSKIRPSHT
jgi:hypothetical protein